MEESNMTIRKRCATDKTPTKRSLVDVVGSQYKQTEKQRYERGLCKLVQQEALLRSLVRHLSVLLFHFGHCFVFSPIQRKNVQSLSCFPFNLQHIHSLTHTLTPEVSPRVRAPQYIFCRLGSTASLRKENTRRIPDLFPLLPLVK